MEFDTVDGRWAAEFGHDAETISVYGRRMRITFEDRIEALPLGALGIDLIIDSTGVFKTPARMQPHYDAGVKKLVVSAPVKEEPALNLVYGVNHDLSDAEVHHLVTAASCTTNWRAPVVKVIHSEFCIEHDMITTLHDVTNTQTIVDKPAKNPRRARSALNSFIPTTTSSATVITLIYPELEGAAERSRRARAYAERLADRLRFCGQKADGGRGSERAVQGLCRGLAERHSWIRRTPARLNRLPE